MFGPTGSYKTSALVIPAVLEWSGPLVATSVKPDLLRATLAHRARLGQVLVIDPLGASGVQPPAGRPWPPVRRGRGPADRRHAGQRDRADPTEEQRPEHRFWKTMGTKFLAPMLFAAATKGLGMAESCTGSTPARTRRSRRSWRPPGCRPRGCLGVVASTAPTGPSTLYATAEEVLPSTATSAWPPPPTGTTWTWTSS